MKKFIVFACSIFLLGGAIGAATGVKISAELKPQTVIVNGNSTNQQIISYQGSTYVPLRSFGDLVGSSIDYKNGNIYIGGSSSAVDTGTVKKEDTSSSYSMKNPAPLGITQSVGVSDYLNSYNASVVVKEVVRGEKALNIIKDTNQFNSDPADEHEYILAKVGVSIQSSKDGKSVAITKNDFKGFSTSNAAYSEFFSVVTPSPELSRNMFEGSSSEGWIAFQVKKDDISPKFVFGSDYNGNGGIWFSLK